MEACTVCRLLSDTLAHYDRDPGQGYQPGDLDLDLGSVSDVASRSQSCPSCQVILQPRNPLVEHAPTSRLTARLSPTQPRVRIAASLPPQAHLTSLVTPAYAPITYFTTLTSSSNPTQPHGRLLNPQHIDTSLVKSWIARCDATHEHLCSRHNDRYLLPEAHLSFIDVEDLCIVTPSVDPKTEQQHVTYAALSYVWGPWPPGGVLLAQKANTSDLKRPGAFAEERFQLPRTVRDAITLTKELGLRLLWVDSVCIVQDEKEEKEVQLRAMGRVYANAYLTIVALSGESAGAGMHRVSVPSDARQEVVSLPGHTLVRVAVDAASLDGPGTTWNTRGWTLQEKLFSRRVLAVDNGMVSWSCFGEHWTEDLARPSEYSTLSAPSDRPNEDKMGAVTWPSIGSYGRLAAEYALRDLTRCSDAVNAFTGVMTPMAAWFPGGLLHGTVEYTFDMGLLWDVVPSWLSSHRAMAAAHLRRDPGTPSPLVASKSNVQFPTWSWISWTRGLNFDIWAAAEDYAYPRGPLTISPLAQWQKYLAKDSRWVDVDNTYHVVRKALANTIKNSTALPNGWTRHHDQHRGQEYYLHDKIVHIVPQPRFSYPIPPFVRYRDVDFRTFEPFLRFRGQSTWAHITIDAETRKKMEETLREGDGHVAVQTDLTTLQGGWCGRVTVSSERGVLGIPANNELCEFIGISEASLDVKAASASPSSSSLFREIRERPELASMETYEVVNVLWVGRWRGDDSKVFRRGLGRIWKPVWETMARRQVELILT